MAPFGRLLPFTRGSFGSKVVNREAPLLAVSCGTQLKASGPKKRPRIAERRLRNLITYHYDGCSEGYIR